MTPIISLKNLCFEYDEGKNTIDHINVDFPEGKHTAILGHNGSGKSTITKLLIGLLEASSGEIVVDGVTLTEKTLYDVRSKIGIVFQNPDNQFIGSTVRDDIAFGLENICVDPNKMDDIIEEYASKVSMNAFLDSEPTKLSGGQKQRVAIAGILAMHPKIIILDEATSMLDPRGRNEINQLIREIIQEENITVISITHDIEEACHCDHIVLMSNGKVINTGSPEEVLPQLNTMNDLKLDIPFAFKLTSTLKSKGINIKETIHQEEAVKLLCQLHSKM